MGPLPRLGASSACSVTGRRGCRSRYGQVRRLLGWPTILALSAAAALVALPGPASRAAAAQPAHDGTASSQGTPSTALFPVWDGLKAGYIDGQGTLVIPGSFKAADAFSEGLAAVEDESYKWGFIDASGRLVVPALYDDPSPRFSEGLALVGSGRESWFIDETGATVLPPRASGFYVDSFYGGLAIVCDEGGRYGFIGRDGSPVIAPQFANAAAFSDGLACVMSDEGDYGYVDASGHWVIPARFWNARRFVDGLAAARSAHGWGFINKAGEFVVADRYKEVSDFSEGLAAVRVGKLWGFIDQAGAMVIQPRFPSVGDFSQELAPASLGGDWGYIDRTGAFVIEPQFTYADCFVDGLAAVSAQGEDRYIDVTGRQVWPRAQAEEPLPDTVAAATLAFVRGGHLWAVRGDGSLERRITGAKADDSAPVWSPDGARIAFVRSESSGAHTSLCVISGRGGRARTLRRAAGGYGLKHRTIIQGCSWSPDGRHLAFTEQLTGTSPYVRNRLLDLDIASGRATVLLDRRGGIETGWGCSWSPDGRTILVSQGGMDAEGSATGLFRIAGHRFRWLPIANAVEAVWAPDGGSILASTLTQQLTTILLATPTGATLRTLASGGSWEGPPGVYGGGFSPDGSWISYTLRSEAIWLMSLDGDQKHFLTYGSWAAWR